MNTIFLQLLADRHGSPAGLLLATCAGQPDEPAQALLLLAAKFPCHYRTGLAERLALPLHRAGWHPLPATRIWRADVPPGKSLPGHVLWIEGDWALAPPERPVGNGAASRALAMQLVQRVSAEADTHEIEELLRHDATLSYHLLRLVNSLGMGNGRKVTSFSQAILLLGRQQLRRWLNLMLFAARGGDERSAMLLARVSVRARLMELLARATGLDRLNQELAFMTGMFSLLGVLFGAPLADVLAPLAIADAVQGALLHRQGELGALLALVEAAERGDFDPVAAALDRAQLPAARFNDMVVEANEWMLVVAGDAAGHGHG
ncbi:EAL and HDOD domain-containing protein [Pseudoduganella umbonata]|uniref:EAL and modified HD-GYP domain-containing signal transduction protein n=1 Tax=Pseudoduganella umbonata TaxID=864828 RepID=A0A4P8HMU8_9BURK|nr:HDOD domain-containing protein [Pseudoduganella umbonata]MBB3224733.1 EAL and modified HD-GYP domain-containing signal transduction protein [Pseudoduganella umbonata]QCP11047.1 HDOD domain-containing protein [Pseudoduganella umbonata]